jgi:hypothetical protein
MKRKLAELEDILSLKGKLVVPPPTRVSLPTFLGRADFLFKGEIEVYDTSECMPELPRHNRSPKCHHTAHTRLRWEVHHHQLDVPDDPLETTFRTSHDIELTKNNMRILEQVVGYRDIDYVYPVDKIKEFVFACLKDKAWCHERWRGQFARRIDYGDGIKAVIQVPPVVHTIIIGYLPTLTVCRQCLLWISFTSTETPRNCTVPWNLDDGVTDWWKLHKYAPLQKREVLSYLRDSTTGSRYFFYADGTPITHPTQAMKAPYNHTFR